MTSYVELKAKAEAMLAEAEAARQQEIASVIKDIKSKMQTYGLTVADFGGVQAGAPKSPAKTKSTNPAKYRGPNGETWAGGLGRKPEWVRALLAEGKNIEDYLI